MNKYKLINKTTGEEHICEKVVVDGWDYYVSDEHKTNFVHSPKDGIMMEQISNCTTKEYKWAVRVLGNKNHRFVLATNNTSTSIPKVMNEVEELAFKYSKTSQAHRTGYIDGYNKSQKTHPFSEEDMIEFLEFVEKTAKLSFESTGENTGKPYKELQLWKEQRPYKELQLWKEQRTKTLYYE